MPQPGASLSYPASIPLSSRSLNHLAGLIRVRRNQRRSRWRRLDPGRQALLALAHLRNGDTLTRLACGFEIGVTTAWRYVHEAIDLLAATADDLKGAMTRIRLLAYVTIDGTLDPDRQGRRPEALLLGETPPPRCRLAGRSGCGRPPHLGLSSFAGRRP